MIINTTMYAKTINFNGVIDNLDYSRINFY